MYETEKTLDFFMPLLLFWSSTYGFSLFFEDKKRLFQIATTHTFFLYIAWFLLKKIVFNVF